MLTFLLFLACGENQEPDEVTSNAEVRADVTAEDTPVSTVVSLDGSPIGTSGECLSVRFSEEPVEITAGDGASYGYSEDNIPLHKEPDGSLWIAPPLTAELQENECFVAHLALNQFAQDEWTCERQSDGRLTTYDVEYRDGYKIQLPGIGDAYVSGSKILPSDEVSEFYEVNGEFVNANLLTATVHGTDGTDMTWEYICWAGDESNRP